MNNLSRIILTLLVASGSVYADYISARVKAGAYYLESKDESVDQNIFQYHALNSSFEKSGVFALLSGSYSDIYKNRGSEYTNDYRLSLAKAGYTTPSGNVTGAVGRMYNTFIDRSVWLDGLDLQYTIKNMLTLQAYGGYVVPTAYDDDFIHTDSEFLTTGGSIEFTGLKNIVLLADYVKASKDDKGTVGLGANVILQEKYDLFTNGVWDFETSSLDHANVSGRINVRNNDQLLLSYTFDDAEQDTTRYFDLLDHPTSNLIQGGYLYNVNQKLHMTLNYGLLLYEDETAREPEDVIAHMIDARVTGYGAYVSFTKEFDSDTEMQEATAGYEYKILDNLLAGVNAGFMRYKWSDDKGESKKEFKNSKFVAVVCEYAVIKNLWLNLEYEFLSNREYSQDHRVFAGLNYSFMKGL
ncbi:MAG: hypothetical protein OCC49_14515 [Fibrobacterales bacterium]